MHVQLSGFHVSCIVNMVILASWLVLRFYAMDDMSRPSSLIAIAIAIDIER